MAQAAALTDPQVEKVLNAFMRHVQEALRKGDQLTPMAVGTLAGRTRAAWRAWHSQTRQELITPASTHSTVRAGKGLREAIKENGGHF